MGSFSKTFRNRFSTQIAMAALVSVFVAGSGPAAHALEFEIEARAYGSVIVANGVIESGDADRLSAIAKQADVLPHGFRILSLNSKGGSVAEALRLAQIIDQFRFQTLVEDGAICASACGSIVFISGDSHLVREGGALGMHTCYSGEPLVANQTCNEIMAQHAMEQGLNHGDIAAFTVLVPPKQMVWFSAEDADCWGLNRYPDQGPTTSEPISPCLLEALFGALGRSRHLEPSFQWRNDQYKTGYVAFVRTQGDHIKYGQITLFCREKARGRISVLMAVAAVDGVDPDTAVEFATVAFDDDTYTLDRLAGTLGSGEDEKFFYFIMKLPREATNPLLTRYETMKIILGRSGSSETLSLSTPLSNGRKEILFAANHCIDR